MIPARKPREERKSVTERTNRSDGRKVQILRKHDFDKRRQELCDRAGSRCEAPGCFRVAPLHTTYWEDSGEVRWTAGEAHHKLHRKAGGGSRDDSMDNLQWLCSACHRSKHIPAKVVPAKVRA